MTLDIADNRLNLPAGNFLKNLSGFLIPVLFFLIITALIPFDRVFEYSFDEGLYLMRAYLHMKGYALYKEVWMDQPPVFVLLLSWLFKLFGPSVQAARFLMLSFSALLLWSVYQIISKTRNAAAALCAVVLIVFSAAYVMLSVAVMGSVPAVALSALAMYGIVLYQDNYRKRYLLLSGGVFALAVLTRFFALVFLCGILVGIVMAERAKTSGRNPIAGTMRAGIWWFAAFAAVFLYISFGASSIDFSQLLKPYLLSAGLSGQYDQSLATWLSEEYDVVVLAVCALIFSRRENRKIWSMPLASLIAGVFVFSSHSPIWFYHRLYIVVPLCWLASFSVYALYDRLKPDWRRDIRQLEIKTVFSCLCLCGALTLSVSRIPLKYAGISGLLNSLGSRGPDYPKLMALMKQYRGQTRMVVTDRPIYAFYADLPVHPFLASCSVKRLRTKLLTTEDFIRIIDTEQPEMVLFGGYAMRESRISPRLRQQYVRYTDTAGTLYVLKKIARNSTGLNPNPAVQVKRHGHSS